MTPRTGGSMTGMVDGRHYTEWVDTIRDLKRRDRLDEAVALLLKCCDAVEDEATRVPWGGIAPWYYEELAIVYRKQNYPSKEVAILERYLAKAGLDEARKNRTGIKLLGRLEKARERLHTMHEASERGDAG